MSYILDALKKAERERGITQVPNLMTVHDFRTGPRRWSWVVGGVLVLCAAAVLWFLFPAIRTIVGRPAPVPQSQVVQKPSGSGATGERMSPATVPSAVALPETGAPKRTQSLPSEKKAGAQQRPVMLTSAQVAPRVVPLPSNAKPAEASSAVKIPQPPPAPTNAVTAEPNPAPMASVSKPASLSEAMAMMNLTVLLYSDTPAERIVFINGRKYVEGDHIDGKYFLETITLEGAVLSYQGERAVLRPRQR
jgi:general secretion pathway protein B